VAIALDAAGSELRTGEGYFLPGEGRHGLSADDLISLYEEWIGEFPIVLIEDGLAEDDWDGWKKLTERLGKKLALVGDDFFVTNADRLCKGIEMGCANAILIKVNQIGTLSETMDAILLAQQNGYAVSVSHRSGETSDTTIADLAVAVNAEYIKTGSLSRSERLAKYNRLMEIEEEILAEAPTS